MERIQIITIGGFIHTLTIFGAQQHYNLPTKIVVHQLTHARINLISARGIKNTLKIQMLCLINDINSKRIDMPLPITWRIDRIKMHS